jgi:hypothetical protein
MGARQHQALFATIEKGYALVIMVGAKSPAEVDQVLSKIGLVEQAVAQPAASVPNVRNAGSPPSPLSLAQFRLQGIGGPAERRLAIINGKTFAKGDAATIKTAAKTVVVRCIDIGESSATVTIEGVTGSPVGRGTARTW